MPFDSVRHSIRARSVEVKFCQGRGGTVCAVTHKTWLFGVLVCTFDPEGGFILRRFKFRKTLPGPIYALRDE